MKKSTRTNTPASKSAATPPAKSVTKPTKSPPTTTATKPKTRSILSALAKPPTPKTVPKKKPASPSIAAPKTPAPAPAPARIKLRTSPATSTIIKTDNDIRTGIRALRRQCQFMRKAHDLAGNPPLRRNQPGFPGLARIIVGQQVSVHAARAIWARVETGVTPMTAEQLMAMSDDALRALGLSGPKVRTLRNIADAVLAGLELDALNKRPESQARSALTAISGVGPWTADIYMMFCVGRADTFASGDLALQVATQMVMDLPDRPTIDDMAEIAERWSPWRGVAARLLWHYYAAAKSQGSALPT